jgi:cardiolipin synthase (CMP-forming)
MHQKELILKRILQDKSWFTFSNLLTCSRIILTPAIVVGIYYQKWVISFWTLFIVGWTDLFDGYLARLLNEDTNLGKFLDPIADKVLLTASFYSLAFIGSPSFPIPGWFVLLIFGRELLILIGIFVMMKAGVKVEISPTLWGKLTTFFQIIFILWMFVCYFYAWVPAKTYYTLLYLLAAISIFSLWQYVKIGINYLSVRKI